MMFKRNVKDIYIGEKHTLLGMIVSVEKDLRRKKREIADFRRDSFIQNSDVYYAQRIVNSDSL